MGAVYPHTYAFTSQAAPADTFAVVRFTGEEGLSRLYSFDILLVSSKKDLDLTALVQSPCTLRLERDNGDLPIHGIPAAFEMQNASQDRVFYRVLLVPKLWWLTHTRHNQIFLDQDLPGFLGQALTDGGLTEGTDFELRLSKSYPRREYVCQYRETHFEFISRWMERDGLYYFFEQTAHGEKLVITDTRTSHAPMAGAETLQYLPPSGLDWSEGERAVKTLRAVRRQVPQRVTVSDYNYRTPDTRPHGESVVSPQGHGSRTLYAEHPQNDAEAAALAKVRAEELACRQTVYEGSGAAPHVRAGYLFSLERHFRDACNTTYLTIDARHEGGQEAYLAQTLGIPLGDAPDRPYYRNSFTAIPAPVQYRAARKTPRPRFYGVLNATIDAAQSGQYAEVDDQGRYKVILPFDLSGRKDGKASSWLRRNQPYGGAGMGLHFPLHKGCGVLLGFLDGDPDRPVIQAAVPDTAHNSLLTSENNTKCLLTTGGGNRIHIEDQEGSERILLQSPTANSWVRCGQPNDPPPQLAPDMLGWKLNTSDTMLVRAGLANSIILGTVEWEYFGNYFQLNLLEALCLFGLKTLFSLSRKLEISLTTLRARFAAQKAVTSRVALNEECIKIAGEVKKMRENVTKLNDLKEELTATCSRLEESRQELVNSRQRLTGNRETLEQMHEQLGEDLNSLYGQRTHLTESKTTIAQQKETIQGQCNSMIQQQTLLAQNNTKVGDQLERLGTQRDIIAEMISNVVGDQEII